jgi:hypothetical protein
MRIQSLTATLLLIAGLTATTAFAAEPLLGRCYMNSCSWMVITSKQVVEKKRGSVLFKIELIGGVSEHEDHLNYPSSYSPDLAIEWGSKSETIFVACDVKRPLIVMDEHIDLLDLHNVPGVMESASNLWVNVCYDAPYAAWASSDWLKKAKIPRLDITGLSDAEVRSVLSWVNHYK